MSWSMLDLFSGIGGFSLAAQWVWGRELKIVAFCEIEPFCQKVLRKHWPNVPIIEDVKKLDGKQFESIDLVTGGFPCQDISIAGKGIGIKGERSSLWNEYKRIIGEVRPRYALVENVSALTFRGLGQVLGDLTEIGYDAEWNIISANDFGALHQRKRIWIVAYPQSLGSKRGEHDQGPRIFSRIDYQTLSIERIFACDKERFHEEIRAAEFIRTPNGIPDRIHRIKALGNAIVPQVAAVIMSAIKQEENSKN